MHSYWQVKVKPLGGEIVEYKMADKKLVLESARITYLHIRPHMMRYEITHNRIQVFRTYDVKVGTNPNLKDEQREYLEVDAVLCIPDDGIIEDAIHF